MEKHLVTSNEQWVLIKEKPSFVIGWADLTLRFYFPHLNMIQSAVISLVYKAFNRSQWCQIISYIAEQLASVQVSINIPSKYRRYNVLVGGGRSHRIDV